MQIETEIKRAVLPGWYVVLINGIEVYRDNAKWKCKQWLDLHGKIMQV